MLAVFYGSDRVRLAKRAGDFISKQDFDEIISFDDSTINCDELLNFTEQSALFGGRKLIKLDGVFDNEDVLSATLKNIELFEKSDNIFVFLETKILAGDLKKLKSHAEVCEEFKLEEKPKEKFNIFSLADALARRDKKSLWVLYQKALRAGKVPEEISGTIFWQLKTLMILEQGGGKTLSPYVVSKNKSAIKNFKEGELANITANLIKNYHEARRGRGDMEVALERLILSI